MKHKFNDFGSMKSNILTLNMRLCNKANQLEYARCERVCTSDKVPAAFVPLPIEHWRSFRCDCFEGYALKDG